MKRLKTFVILSTLALAVPALAETPDAKKEMNFEQRKEAAIARLDKRIGVLQGLRGCITAATNRDDMKRCRETYGTGKKGGCGK